jgi:hypothetical protein
MITWCRFPSYCRVGANKDGRMLGFKVIRHTIILCIHLRTHTHTHMCHTLHSRMNTTQSRTCKLRRACWGPSSGASGLAAMNKVERRRVGQMHAAKHNSSFPCTPQFTHRSRESCLAVYHPHQLGTTQPFYSAN